MTNNKPFKGEKSDRTGYLISRLVCLAFALIYIAFGIVFRQKCDIDKIYLSCRLTGTVGDWIGSIMILAMLFFMSGIHKGINNLYNPPGSVGLGIVVFVLGAIGFVLVWNL